MASGRGYLTFLSDRLAGSEDLTYRPMMGECLLYVRGRVVGGIYDDRLPVKPVPAARALLPDAVYERPYPGGKAMLLAEEVNGRDFLRRLFHAVYADLPPSKKRF